MYFPQMATEIGKKSQKRMAIAITLFLASITTSFAFAFLSHQGSAYWVVTSPIPKGVAITREDVEISRMKLSRATDGYIKGNLNPVGVITKRSFASGELLLRSAITASPDQLSAERVSLSLRSVDIPASIVPGDRVTIYQLHDASNGEEAIEPQLILSSLFLVSIEGRKGNFSGDVSVTISLDRKEIPTLLAATTSGRLVVVATSG
jgi:hypothetical protein